ncbi:hypothetical protein MNBD_GAMMA21-2808 [hydrothermal vent metagenome]|uniref:Lipoprotein n=1 Tax=hydrothermal vent metagenome TaxID=652676 RepID=A0A3B0ZUZ0_9ZZZZ
MIKVIFILFMFLTISGCTSLNVKPAHNVGNNEICVIENNGVNPDFTTAYLRQIKNNGYRVKIVNSDEAVNCEFTSTYSATYGQHWGVYLATSQLKIYHKGLVIGEAKYNAPFASPAKHGRVEDKIDDMVNELLPAR